MTLPRYIAARHIALALGPEWRTQRVSRILTAMGIARKLGKARGVFVTPEDLAGAWPEMFEGILERLEDIEPVKEKKRYHARCKKPANNKDVSKQTRVKTDTTTPPTYDYDSNPCEYEVGGKWSCGPECVNQDHCNHSWAVSLPSTMMHCAKCGMLA